jgi:hypothetical protein
MAVLAEDLLLLLLDDDSGRPVVDGTALDYALAGAVLLELAESGRVSPAGSADDAKEGRLLVGDASPTGDGVLDRALDRLNAKDPVKAQRAVELLAKDLRPAVLEQLANRGLVRREEHRVLGIFPRTSWPAADAEWETSVRARLTAVLVGGQAPDAHIGGLVCLLHAINAVHKVVKGDRKQLRARAAEISAGAWTGDAVKKAVEAVEAAVMVAVTTATTAEATSGDDGGAS